MEYLFADAGFISLNAKRRRETASPRLRPRRCRRLKGSFPMGDLRDKIPGIASHRGTSPHSVEIYRGDPLTDAAKRPSAENPWCRLPVISMRLSVICA